MKVFSNWLFYYSIFYFRKRRNLSTEWKHFSKQRQSSLRSFSSHEISGWDGDECVSGSYSWVLWFTSLISNTWCNTTPWEATSGTIAELVSISRTQFVWVDTCKQSFIWDHFKLFTNESIKWLNKRFYRVTVEIIGRYFPYNYKLGFVL